MRQHILLTALLLSLLTGCSLLPPQEQIQGQGNLPAWNSHKEQLQHINGWQISGKIGLKVPKPAESGSGSIFWLQRQDYFDIRLAGPLGQGAVRLTGRPDQVTLDVAGHGQMSADSPEAMLEETLGWSLPVSHLYWWIRGLPAPDSRSKVELNHASQLATLEQAGWHVEYSRYGEHQGFSLPERIKLSRNDIEATVVIKDWQARHLGAQQ